jgi:hypothetical protein
LIGLIEKNSPEGVEEQLKEMSGQRPTDENRIPSARARVLRLAGIDDKMPIRLSSRFISREEKS